jgi:eukaryotic-like serine/threonine-protein kinase
MIHLTHQHGPDSSDRDRRLDEAIAAYLAAEDNGNPPARGEFLNGYPDLADGLRAFFREHDRFGRLAQPLHAAAAPVAATVDVQPNGAGSTADGANRPDDGLPAPGDRVPYFGDYQLLKVLGHGGMCVVYMARQISLNRQVALKMIAAGELASDADLHRFRNEAEAVAGLDHPHIVPIYEVGEHDGRHYFSMKLIPGGSLTQRLSEFTADPRSAAQLLATVAEAVHHAHRRGILHRDLKPSNILLDEERRPHVTDFGLAKRVEGDSELTQSGAIVGTPAYMAPEQASGRRGSITTATDVHGLGAVLYAMLTGRPPFRGESVLEVLQQVREQDPEPPSKLNPRVPRNLETVCLKCLEKDPRRRYDSAAALAEDLDRWLRGEPIVARPVGRGERLWLWCRRNPVVASLLGAVTALLVALAVGSTIAAFSLNRLAARERQAAGKERDATAEARKAAAQAVAAEEAARTSADDARRNHYVAHMNLAQVAWEAGEIPRVRALLDQHRNPPNGPVDPRGWEWHYLDRIGEGLLTLGKHEGEIVMHNAEGERMIERPCPVTCLAFSPDGSRLASTGADLTIKLWDVPRGRLLRELKGHSLPVNGLAFSPDGAWLGSAGADGVVRVWDLATAREAHILRGEAKSVYAVAFEAADGSRLVAVDREMIVHWEVPSERVRSTTRYRLYDWTGDDPSHPGRPDLGHRIIRVGTSRMAVGDRLLEAARVPSRQAKRDLVRVGDRLWDLETGKSLNITVPKDLPGYGGIAQSGEWDVRIAALSPDGQLWARTGGMPWAGPVVVGETSGGGTLRVFAPESIVNRAMALDPDGEKLALAGLSIRDLASGKTIFVDLAELNPSIVGEYGAINWAEFSPDGTRLALACDDGTVRLSLTTMADAERMRPRARVVNLQDDPGDSWEVWSPDRDVVATFRREEAWITVYDSTSGAKLGVLQNQRDAILNATFTADGKRLVSIDRAGAVMTWNWARGQIERRVMLENLGKPINKDPNSLLATLSTDGSLAVTTRLKSREVSESKRDTLVFESRLWDTITGRALPTPAKWARYDLPFLDHTRLHLGGVTFSPSGSRVAYIEDDHTVGIWDVARQEGFRLRSTRPIGMAELEFDRDGSRLACHSSPYAPRSHPAHVTVWDLASGREQPLKVVASLHGHFNPDWSRLVTSDGGPTLRLWDTTSGEQVFQLKLEREFSNLDSIHRMIFSPDGGRIFIASSFNGGGKLACWDARPATAEVRDDREAIALLDYLIERPMLRSEVLAHLRESPALSESVRRRALFLTERSPDNPRRLTDAAWNIVCWSGRSAPTYRRALLVMEAIARPTEGLNRELDHLASLGAALYRVGRHREALEILSQMDKIDKEDPNRQLGFGALKALSLYQLGRTAEARDVLEHVSDPWFGGNERTDEGALYREARELLATPFFPSDPFAP